MEQPENFDQYCLVEMMGRQRIAGKVTERVIAGQGFLQVDVPETTHNPKFTRFISPSALYALNPIDEATARAYAENLRVKPIDAWDINAFMEKVEAQKLLTKREPTYDQDYEDRQREADRDMNEFEKEEEDD